MVINRGASFDPSADVSARDAEDGNHTYKETKAPSGYALNPTAYNIEIDEKGAVAGTLEITDPFANIVLKKVDAKTRSHMASIASRS